MKFKNKKLVYLLPLFLALAMIAGILIGNQFARINSLKSTYSYRPTNKISAILNYIDEEYVDSVSLEDITEDAIPTILLKLDPHSIYIPAKKVKEVNEPLEGNFEGIGVSFNMKEDTILIISPHEGGPSYEVGILAGDRIVKVNDTVVAGVKMREEDIMSRLKGPSGTKVNVSIYRRGEAELLDFEITRGHIPIKSVDVAYMINDDMGYMKISKFSKTTYTEFMDGLESLKEQDLKKLIIDLRDNTGGYMLPATQIADEFLKKGKLIVYTEGRARPRSETRATDKYEGIDIELAIIIDEGSASASEILAGAIQDNDRGTIIGRRSFGKGLVQEPTMFTDGSAMRLTIARYYTPTGRCIQKPYDKGIVDYYQDINRRFVNGELTESDSIHFDDSLKYTTPGGKTVYGGGGIMPDVFVPYDTTGITPEFIHISNKGHIYQFALLFSDKNREKLNQLTDVNKINQYLEEINIYGKFYQYIREKGEKYTIQSLKDSKFIINTQVKAYIARNIIDNQGFFPIIKDIDIPLQEAIKSID